MVLENIRHTCLKSVASHTAQLEEHGGRRGLVAVGMLVETECLEGQVECSRDWSTVGRQQPLLEDLLDTHTPTPPPHTPTHLSPSMPSMAG